MAHTELRVEKIHLDTSDIDSYLYEYLRGLEKQIMAVRNEKLKKEKEALAQQAKQQRQVEEARYIAKPFDEQLDDLVGELEEQMATAKMEEGKEIKPDSTAEKIARLERQIEQNIALLGQFSEENLERITSTFEERRRYIAGLPRDVLRKDGCIFV